MGFADHVSVLLVVVAPVLPNPPPLGPLASTMFIRFSSRLHMSNVSFPLSTHTSILLSLLVSIFLLALIRAALLFLRTWISPSQEKHSLIQEQPKNVEQQLPSSSSSSWGLGFFRWDNLPTLPVSLKINENDMKGRGVGFVAPQRPAAQPWRSGRRAGPAFESPRKFFGFDDRIGLTNFSLCFLVPAMYQTDVPVSMAKMIMSRHVGAIPFPYFP